MAASITEYLTKLFGTTSGWAVIGAGLSLLGGWQLFAIVAILVLIVGLPLAYVIIKNSTSIFLVVGVIFAVYLIKLLR